MSTKQEVISGSEKNHLETNDVMFPEVTHRELLWTDIIEGFTNWRIWMMLSYQDIKLRYRRSILGPFWLTISMGITVYTMGFLYAHLFHSDLKRYYPFLVAGMLSWSLISTVILELTDGFITYEALLKQIKLPYTLYIHRISARNIIIFFHNIIVMVPIFFIYHSVAKINLNSFLLIPGLLVIYFNALTYGIILAMIGSRYRDISQIIKSLIQVIFFLTPVMWGPEILSENKRFIVDLNPFYAYIELVRAPLVGNMPTLTNIIVVSIFSLLGLSMSYFLFKRYRARIVYWL